MIYDWLFSESEMNNLNVSAAIHLNSRRYKVVLLLFTADKHFVLMVTKLK